MRLERLSILALAAVWIGCGDEDKPAADTLTGDTADTADPDTTPGETAAPDTDPADTAVPDTSPADTVDDTSPADLVDSADADEPDTISADADTSAESEVSPEPTITERTGAVGQIQIYEDAIFAFFFADNTIVHFSDAPECVLHVGPSDRLGASAGTLTLGGPIVGASGAAEAPYVIEPDCSASYFGFGPTYPPDDALALEVSLSGAAFAPAMPPQTLSPSPAGTVELLAPIPNDDFMIVFDSAEDFELAWTPPVVGGADQRIVFGLTLFAPQPHQPTAQLFCGFPLESGQATIPANVLSEVARRIGSGAPGMVHILAGGQAEFQAEGASYVIEAARALDSTTIAFDIGAELVSDLEPPPPPEPEPIVIPEPAGPTPGGAVHCARALGGVGADAIADVVVGADGSIFVAGSFVETASFGSDADGAVALTAEGDRDLFVARYDADCQLVWARRAGGIGGDVAQAVAVGDAGVYVAGTFSDTATFGAGEAGAQSVVSRGQQDFYVAHYRADGTLGWVRAGGGAGGERLHGLAAGPAGVYVSGRFAGTAIFEAVELVAGVTYNATAFLARYTSEGALEWARPVGDGDAGDVDVFDVTVVGSDAIVIGNYNGTAVFDPGGATESRLGADWCSGVEAFVARIAASGAVSWVKGFGGAGFDYPLDVTADLDGSVLVTGSFGGSVTFGAGEGGAIELAGAESEIFAARFDGATGEARAATSAGSPFGERGTAIHPTADGFVVVGVFGRFGDRGYAVFGEGDATRTTLVSDSGDSGFIARYDDAGALSWARAVAGADNRSTGVAVAANGDVVVVGSFAGQASFDATTVGPAAGDSDGFITVYRP